MGIHTGARLWPRINTDINNVIGVLLMPGGLQATGRFSSVPLIMVLTSILIMIIIHIIFTSSTVIVHGPVYTGAVARTNWSARYYPTKLVNTQRVQT